MSGALVTGASRGLGAEIAARLAEAGWAVAVNYAHDDAGAQRTVARIAAAGGTAFAARFDITDSDQISRGIETVRSELGPIDLLVNNATGPQSGAPIMEQSWELYLQHLEFFVKAPLLLLQGLLPDWRVRKTGRVINIGSEVAKIGSPFDAHYVAAKAAMVGLTRSWASELGPEGITVNLVSPGWIPVERHAGTADGEYERHLAGIPLNRMGIPADVAATVAFIASKGADYLTGQDIAVNGGRTYL
jgi:3-oxoacyl-[acyl-carrier protein] reductase